MFDGLRSDLQPTRMTGMVGPHMERTSSIHCGGGMNEYWDVENVGGGTFTVTLSRESGVSMAKAMRMTCDLEYDMGLRRCFWISTGSCVEGDDRADLVFFLTAGNGQGR